MGPLQLLVAGAGIAGPLLFPKKEQKTTQRRAQSPEELAFLRAQSDIAQQQLSAIRGVSPFVQNQLLLGQPLLAQQLGILQKDISRFFPQTQFQNLTLPQATQFIQQGGLSPLIGGAGGDRLADDERMRLLAEQERLGARDFSPIRASINWGTFNPIDDDPVPRLTEAEEAENKRRRISEQESVARLAEIESQLNLPTQFAFPNLQDFQAQQTLQQQQQQAQQNLLLKQGQQAQLLAQQPTPSTGVNLGGQRFRSSLTPLLNQAGGGLGQAGGGVPYRRSADGFSAWAPPGVSTTGQWFPSLPEGGTIVNQFGQPEAPPGVFGQLGQRGPGIGLAGAPPGAFGLAGTPPAGIGGRPPTTGLTGASAALQRAAQQGRLFGQTASSVAGGLPLSQEEFLQQFRDILSVDEIQGAQQSIGAQRGLLEAELQRIQRGPGVATPEQLTAIEEARAAQVAAGEIDIERARTENLRVLREELAPRLGLRPGDTPILDRGGLIAAEALRQQGVLGNVAGQAAAQARLSFPLAASQLQSQQTQAQQTFGSALSQFQQQLNQQAFQNRLLLSQQLGGIGTQAGEFGLGLAGVQASPGRAFGDIADAQKLGTVTASTPGFGDIIGGVSGGLGALSELNKFRLGED
jgi:hypothetical protein